MLERAGFQVVGEAANGREALAEALRLRPEVVVMDIGMPELNGVDATRQLTAELPATKVVALTMSADRHYVFAMLDAGARGYLLKNAAADELLSALTAVMQGQTYLSPAIAGCVAYRVSGGRAHEAAGRPLSSRERQVLQLIAEGKTSKEVAADLGIAVPTVETHRRQIMEKLALRTVAELTKYAIREGLTSADQ